MSLIESILKALRDGDWHSINKVLECSEQYTIRTMIIINFLCHFDFVEVNKSRNQVRFTPPMFTFMNDSEEIEA